MRGHTPFVPRRACICCLEANERRWQHRVEGLCVGLAIFAALLAGVAMLGGWS